MKENEVYGVSMATLQVERQQPLMPDDALMSKNVCYATTHMEIVDNECYGCVPDDALMSRNVCYATTVQHVEIVDNECYSCIPEK